MVLQHQGNSFCAVADYVNVLDGITPTDMWHPLQVFFERCTRASALIKEGTHFMWFLLEIELHIAQMSDPEELTVRNALLAVWGCDEL